MPSKPLRTLAGRSGRPEEDLSARPSGTFGSTSRRPSTLPGKVGVCSPRARARVRPQPSGAARRTSGATLWTTVERLDVHIARGSSSRSRRGPWPEMRRSSFERNVPIPRFGRRVQGSWLRSRGDRVAHGRVEAGRRPNSERRAWPHRYRLPVRRRPDSRPQSPGGQTAKR